MQNITIGSRIALENEALEIVEDFRSALRRVIIYKRPQPQINGKTAIEGQPQALVTCTRESFDEHIRSLKEKPREMQQAAIAQILDTPNPIEIAEAVSNTIQKFCLSLISSYNKRLTIISNLNPAIDLSKYYLPKERTETFIRSVRSEMIAILSQANIHGQSLIAINKILKDNHDVYTGERQKIKLKEQRDKSIVRKFRPLFVAISNHPIISIAIQKGTDALVEKKLDSATSKIRQIYEETFQKYIENLHSFIGELEFAESKLVHLAEQKATSICVAAPSEVLADVVAQGGNGLIQNNKIESGVKSIASARGNPKTSSARNIMHLLAAFASLAVLIIILTIHFNKTSGGATPESSSVAIAFQRAAVPVASQTNSAAQQGQLASSVPSVIAATTTVSAPLAADSISANPNNNVDFSKDKLRYDSSIPPQIASILQGVQSNNLTQVNGTVAQIEASPQPRHGDRVAARRSNRQGLNYLSAKNYSAAIQSFKFGLAFDSADPEIINNLAFSQIMSGHYVTAKDNLFKTLLLAPQRASAWVNLGQLYAQTNQTPLAVQCFLAGYNFSTDKQEALGYFKSMENSGNNPLLANVAAIALAQIKMALPSSTASASSGASSPAAQPFTQASGAAP